jgi:hypothetical protein
MTGIDQSWHITWGVGSLPPWWKMGCVTRKQERGLLGEEPAVSARLPVACGLNQQVPSRPSHRLSPWLLSSDTLSCASKLHLLTCKHAQALFLSLWPCGSSMEHTGPTLPPTAPLPVFASSVQTLLPSATRTIARLPLVLPCGLVTLPWNPIFHKAGVTPYPFS